MYRESSILLPKHGIERSKRMACCSCFRQLRLLLWKNFMLHYRQLRVTIVELLLPVLFSLLLIVIRTRITAETISQPTTWSAFNITELPPPSVLGPNAAWNLAYTPNSMLAKSIVEKAMEGDPTRFNFSLGFDTESEMIKYLQDNTKLKNILAGIVFDFSATASRLPWNNTYKIRMPFISRAKQSGAFGTRYQNKWMTEMTFPVFQTIGPRELKEVSGGSPGYYREGFLTLQYHIDRALMTELGVSNVEAIEMRRMPFPPYIRDSFVLAIQSNLPLILILGFVYAAINIGKNVCEEKQKRLKETMKMMGLQSWLHWTCWFIDSFLRLAFVSLVISVICKIRVSQGRYILTYSSILPFLIFLLLYSCCIIFFEFAISTCFKTSRGSSTASALLFLCSYLPMSILQPRYQTTSLAVKLVLCLFPNTALALGCRLIGQFEGTGAGLQFDNFFTPTSADDSLTMGAVCIMLVVDSFIFMVFAWYIEAILPGDYGIPQPLYFPFLPSYWCGTRPISIDVDAAGHFDLGRGGRSGTISNPNIEPDPHNLNLSVSLRNLRKVFKAFNGKKKVAVDDLCLNIYEGQITALLGHNGAGKSTTMSMIAGFIPSTDGQVLVNGLDIQHNLATIRQKLGLCPQHDVLFDKLTVEEHLKFFARLKNYDESLLQGEVDRLIAATNLEAKRNELSETLSGGMKRRLSVAIALVGGSKLVILDEPTSGLDPNARREIWSFLQNERSRCTILLSTHFMDEADFLGDRIAIMASGKLKCCGSSLFLKSRYGAGYHLTMVKSPGCNISAVTRLIAESVPESKLVSDVGDELSFILPTEASPKFEGLFCKLETECDQLGISGYGASVTTMEEVFLKVGEEVAADQEEEAVCGPPQSLQTCGNNLVNSSEHLVGASVADYLASRNVGIRLFFQQIWGIFIKRMIHSWRNKIITITQLVVPLFFTIVGLIVIKTQPQFTSSPPLTLDLARYGRQVITVASSASASPQELALASAFRNEFQSRSQTSFFNLQNVNATGLQQALSDRGKTDIAVYNMYYMMAGFFASGSISALFNDQAYHTPGISLNALSNAQLKRAFPNASITTINQPQPQSGIEKVSDNSQTVGFATAINIVFGLAYLAASFTFFLVKERVSKVKLLHFVSGTGKSAYWIATFLWDMINFIIPTIGITIVFIVIKIDAYSSTVGRVLGLFLLIVLYGWAVIPQMYIGSYLFTIPSSAIAWMSTLNLMTGLATLLTVFILQIPAVGLKETADILKLVFTFIFPSFCIGQGLTDYYDNYLFSSECGSELIQDFCKFGINLPCCKGNCEPNCVDWTYNYLSFEKGGIGLILTSLALQGVVYFLICLFIESSIATRIRSSLTPSRWADSNPEENTSSSPSSGLKEDTDVAAERQFIANSDLKRLLKENSLLLSDVTHLYGNHLAVDRLSCCVQPGDCFGLLGVNGAGKTTTFKMITGDLDVSRGDAFINGYSVTKNIGMVRTNLGYCPQFDGLIEQLTGRETLTLFARIRGLNENLIRTEVNFLISSLLLEPHADKLTGTYSGGNKRKLSTAMALVGGPAVVCLDEPTTGMDPVARRHLWRAVTHFRERGHTLVLTSHSMEECEALCTKIAIMVNGQFRCLGSNQHLKGKFGSGYALLMQVPFTQETGDSVVERAQQFVKSEFPSAELLDIHQGILHYQLHTAEGVTWSRVFGVLERNKETLQLENYSVSQTTLEQVFIGFARSQIPPEEKKYSCLGNCWKCFTCSNR